MLEDFFKFNPPPKDLGGFRCDGTYRMGNDTFVGVENLRPLREGEEFDIEKMNFLGWMKTATREELDVARKNNAAKLAELTIKYENDLRIMALTNNTNMEDFERKMIMLKSGL